jgi:type IV fimbrial biogenesis protein FimT
VTLIEFLTALSVVAILSAIAAPSFANLLGDASRSTAVNGFFHALFLARSEAIKRNQVVSVCKSHDGSRCLHRGVDWTGGWLVFVNADRDDPPQRDVNETILAVYEGWTRGSITSNRLAYSFRPQAQAVVNGTILFCDARGAQHARAIIVSHTGRPRVSSRDGSGRALACPG